MKPISEKELKEMEAIVKLRKKGTTAFKKSFTDIMDVVDDRIQQLAKPEMQIRPDMSQD